MKLLFVIYKFKLSYEESLVGDIQTSINANSGYIRSIEEKDTKELSLVPYNINSMKEFGYHRVNVIHPNTHLSEAHYIFDPKVLTHSQDYPYLDTETIDRLRKFIRNQSIDILTK